MMDCCLLLLRVWPAPQRAQRVLQGAGGAAEESREDESGWLPIVKSWGEVVSDMHKHRLLDRRILLLAIGRAHL